MIVEDLKYFYASFTRKIVLMINEKLELELNWFELMSDKLLFFDYKCDLYILSITR
jgi:hypothetical protein